MPGFLRFSQLLLAAWCLSGCWQVLLAQESAPAAAPPAVAEAGDAGTEALKKELTDVRNSLARFSEAGAGSRLPEGIDPAQLVERIQDLDQLVRALGRHLSLLEQKRDADRNLTAARATEEAWTGFKEDPPYSMLWADDLAKRLALLSEKRASFQSSIALFERTLDGLDKEATGVIAAKEAAEEQLAKAEAPASSKWLAEAAAGKYRTVIARANSLRANIALLQVQLSIVGSERNLLEDELQVVRRNVNFSGEDLQKLEKSAAERQAAIRKEIDGTSRKLRDAQAVRNAVKAELDKQPASEAEVEIRRLRLAAAETRAEVLQFIAENLGALEGIEGYVATAYQNRRTLAGIAPKATREAALQSLTTLRDRVAAWEVVSGNELAAVNADLTQQGVVAAEIPADDPRSAPLAEIRAALWTKQSFLQRVVQTTGDLRKSTSRWVDENKVTTERTLATRFRDSLSYAWVNVRRVWDFNVSKYEETTPTGGKIQRSVKLGTFIQALIFFGIAYFVLASISRRMQRVVVRRNHIGEAQANTLRTWMMIVVAVGLALATLNFLSIPLTLFAFFGGALAIGLGFGTQTLIKNFISGIIVLFERKIRVGDIVDIGGGAGTITEINTRSSVLRGGDGRETLVPNSLFLENQVTNLTLSNRRVRRTLRVRVALGSSPHEVSTVLTECAERHGLVLRNPAPIVTFEDFAENAHVFAIYYWTEFNSQTDSDVVASDLRFIVEKRFAETGIRFASSRPESPAPPAPNASN
ncbi:MAG: mechanosensitive ion channel domain-containing protein [Verrucomicrobiota bacterium]